MILWEFHIMDTNSTHLPVPHIYHVPAVPLQWKLKNNSNQTKTNKKRNLFTPPSFAHLQQLLLHPGGTRNCYVTHSVPFCLISFSHKCSLQLVFSLVLGLWFLVLHPHWILTETPLGYPATAQSHRDTAGILALHELQQSMIIARVDVKVGQYKGQLWPRVVAELVRPVPTQATSRANPFSFLRSYLPVAGSKAYTTRNLFGKSFPMPINWSLFHAFSSNRLRGWMLRLRSIWC